MQYGLPGLFSRLNSTKSLSLSAQERCSGAQVIFMAHSFSRQSVPVSNHPLPYVQSKHTFFQYKTIALCPVATGPGKKSPSVFLRSLFMYSCIHSYRNCSLLFCKNRTEIQKYSWWPLPHHILLNTTCVAPPKVYVIAPNPVSWVWPGQG